MANTMRTAVDAVRSLWVVWLPTPASAQCANTKCAETAALRNSKGSGCAMCVPKRREYKHVMRLSDLRAMEDWNITLFVLMEQVNG